MKPFNLEEALAGKPVVTRDGKDVTDIHYFKNIKNPFCVYAEIEDQLIGCDVNGKFLNNGDHGKDLFMKTEKKEYWVNVYKNMRGEVSFSGVTSGSEEKAKKNMSTDMSLFYIKTVKIYEEEV